MIGTDRGRVRLTGRMTALMMLTLVTAGCTGGCGDHRPSAKDSVDEALRTTNQARMSIAKFSGKVTIDGNTPQLDRNQALVVMLYNPDKPPPNGKIPRPFKRCDKNGNFVFNTYENDDGVPVGKYVVLFAQFGVAMRGYLGPDKLMNHFNDPDKNRDVKEFNLDLTAPGRSDWTFDLAVAGKDPVQKPGPHAVTSP